MDSCSDKVEGGLIAAGGWEDFDGAYLNNTITALR
jgi:hypothetical protein